MTKDQVLSFITEIGIVPVVRTSSAEGAIKAIEAIYRGGIRAAEITMTVPGAIKALEKLADQFGNQIMLGAGTVLDPETARACMLAGAQFFVTPSLRVSTIEMVKRYAKVSFPGAVTPTEVLAAWEAGADIVKIFPCGNVGGAKYIKALKGPFPQVPFVPTGGVSLNTAAEFIEAGAAALGVGGECVQAEALKANKPEIIVENARKFLAIVRQARAQMASSGVAAKSSR